MDLLELKQQGSKIMNLEAKKKEYQKILVEEYRKSHMEETEGLSNEEIALMGPISENDITFLIFFFKNG